MPNDSGGSVEERIELVGEHALMIAAALKSWTVDGEAAIATAAATDYMARSLAWQALKFYERHPRSRAEPMTDKPRYQQVRVTATYDIEVEVPSDGWWIANVDAAALRANTMTSLEMKVIES